MKKQFQRGFAAAASLVAVGAANAAATVPAGIDTAISDYGAMGVAIVTAMAVAGASFIMLRKALTRSGLNV